MFGTPITSSQQVAVGANGYILSFDLSALLLKEITSMQLFDTLTNTLSDQISESMSLAALMDLPNSATSPAGAFAQYGQTVFVFLLTTTYPYVATTEIAFWFKRNAQRIILTTDKWDIPPESKELAKALALKKTYEGQGKIAPFVISNAVRRQKAILGL